MGAANDGSEIAVTGSRTVWLPTPGIRPTRVFASLEHGAQGNNQRFVFVNNLTDDAI